MTKKDYIAIANIIRGDFESAPMNASGSVSRGAIFCLALSLADYMARDNPLFNRAKFYETAFGTSHLDTVSFVYMPRDCASGHFAGTCTKSTS